MATTIQMKKEINLTYAFAVMTGCIIGSGIFISPTSVIQHSGSVGLALLLWVLCGAFNTPIVLCYAELGCLYPHAGGEYNFYKEVLGPLAAFLVAWVYTLVILPSVFALFTLTTTIYLFYPFYQDCPPPQAVTKLISVWILGTLPRIPGRN